MKRKFVFCCSFMILCCFWLISGMSVYAKDVVVVIDPGHGGENLGAEWEDHTEKDMTMVIANAMKEELEKYEGVSVYLTREDDTDLSLQERCDIADAVHADFLFCLHLNMFETHDVYGSEVWIPSKGKNYVKGYQFADIVLGEFEDLGLYIRGIKTRLNDRGGEYYGILRHSEEYGYPCALVEHCHLDHKNDVPFYDSVEDLEKFGVLDATAVAKYFGLSSNVLGVDYSGYELVSVDAPSVSIAQDLSPADFVEFSVDSVVENEGNATLNCSLEADDYDSYVLYYSYSFDGGRTYSELYPLNRETSAEFCVDVPYGIKIDMMARVYNKYDQIAESGVISLGVLKDPNAVQEEESKIEEPSESLVSFELEENELGGGIDRKSETTSTDKVEKNKFSLKQKLLIAGALFFVSVFSVVIAAVVSNQMIKATSRKKRDREKQSGTREELK